jgi:hypothetical protein
MDIEGVLTSHVGKLQRGSADDVCIGHVSMKNLFRDFILWKKRQLPWNVYPDISGSFLNS